MNGLLAIAGGAPFAPHGYCINYDPPLLTIVALGDALTAVAWVIIPLQLLVLAWRSGAQPLLVPGKGWALGLLLTVCAFGALHHVLQVVLLWRALYWLSAIEGLVQSALALFASAMLQFAVFPGLATPAAGAEGAGR